MIQILYLLFFYFLILYSIIGYGRIYTLINSNYQASSFDGLIGIATLILISYFSNIFFSHDYIHNLIIILFGILIFVFDLKKNFQNRILEYRDISIIFLIIFIGILLYKNHDDFYYYHFPYTVILTNFEKIFGLGNLNHGFRTPSSIFYLNSLFYLPGIKYFLMNSGAAYILGFSNFIIYKNIRELINKKEFNHILYLCLFSLVYINSSFARIAEHGTDRSALILIFLLSIYYLKSINYINSKNKFSFIKIYYSKLSILFSIIISLKVFYIVYSIIFVVWFYQIRKFLNLNKLFSLTLKNYYTYIFILIFFFTIFTIFSNTGCLIYPASFTCFENLSWSIPFQQVDQMHIWYEQWSKAGATPNFRADNPEIYISGFNWFQNWFNTYFFNKVSDQLLVIIFISLIIFFLFSFKAYKQNKINYNYRLFYFVIILLFLEWFYNHPALRYGGYTLLALLFFLPISIYLGKYKVDYIKVRKKIYIILILVIFVFSLRNIVRINKEYNQYGYNPFNQPFFYLNKDGFILNDEVKKKYEIWKKESKDYLIISK